MGISTLAELEAKLRGLSHSEEAINAIQEFSGGLKDTAARLAVFNADRVMLRPPIRPEEAQALGFDRPDDAFALLQGDVVSTESAFYLGERVTGNPKYIVLSSSCDLVPDRRHCAALLRIVGVRASERAAKAKLSLLLKFSKRDSMYLPAMPSDAPDVVGNVILFDGICQIRSADLLLANRIASLSLPGWRVFASFSRTVIVRANPRETEMREAIEHQPVQQMLGLGDPVP